MGNPGVKNWNHPTKWRPFGNRVANFFDPKMPKPDAPPPPPDESAPLFKELARQATEKELRKGRGRAGSFLSPEPITTPGTGGR